MKIISVAVLLAASISLTTMARAQESFAVATIRPSAGQVKFERDGRTTVTPGTLRMQDVTVATCIKWAYGVQDSQIVGPGWLQQDHFDIEAKADDAANEAQMKLMMRALLAERFQFAFHRAQKELHSYAMTAPKGAAKLHPAAADAVPVRQNSANGTVAKGMTMQEFADFIAGPLQAPVVDKTGLPGRYNFVLDFTSYLPPDMAAMRPDATTVIFTAMQGELGLKLEPRKQVVEVMVVDKVEKPSAN
jgi:uncharacterized protein (TIGR03435 family)